MSVSGVGGSSSVFAQWAALQQARAAAAAQQAPSAIASLGTPVTGLAPADAGVHSVTGASGRAMNGPDAKDFQQTMTSLASDLNAGDVTAAQSDFSKLQKMLKSSGVHGHHHHGGKAKAAGDAAGAAATGNPFASAFDALGQALQGGDVAAAQTAYTRLDTLLQNAPRKLTQPPVGADSPANPAGGSIDRIA